MGLVGGILVKVGDFYFPIDFVILDTDTEMLNFAPSILGRSFSYNVQRNY